MPTLSRQTAASAEAKARSAAAFVQATTALLSEGRSYGELGIEVIAKRAGFSRPTFYAYFRDKRDLLFALTEHLSTDVDAQTASWLENRDEDLRAALASVLEVFRTHRGVVGALVEASTYDPEVAELWRDFHGRFISSAGDRIRREHPTLDPDAANARAFALVWMTERVCYEHLIAPNTSDRALLDAFELLWRAGVTQPA